MPYDVEPRSRSTLLLRDIQNVALPSVPLQSFFVSPEPTRQRPRRARGSRGRDAPLYLLTFNLLELDHGSLSSAKRPQAPMEKLAGERGVELHGFDAIFIHVGTQR